MIRSRTQRLCGIIVSCFLSASVSAASKGPPPRPRIFPDSVPATSLSGIALDSLHNEPLVGATISVSGSRRQATTGTDGRFSIDSVDAGVHDITISHPFADSIGLSLGAKSVTLHAGQAARAAFAVPSDRGLRRIFCGGDGPANSRTMLVGRVATVETNAPVSGATVELDWLEVGFQPRRGIVSQPRHLSATTNSAGRYVFCNLSDSLDATIRARTATDSSGEITLSLGDKPVGIQYLFLPPKRIGAATDSSQSSFGIVRGRVHDVTGHPVEGATVDVIRGQVSVATRTDGEFQLGRAPMGTQLLRVRRIGFQESLQPIVVTSLSEKQFDIELRKPVAALDPVVVRARLSDAAVRSGFEKRAQAGAGQYVLPNQLQNASCIFSRIHITGITLVPGASSCSARILPRDRGLGTLPNSIAAVGTGLDVCADFYVDDIPEPQDFEDNSWRLEWLNPKSVVGIEVYSVGTAPMRFPHRLGCSLVLIWTSSFHGTHY